MTIDERINKRLGRRQEMQERINEWEKPAKVISWKKPAIGLAIAACLTLLLVVRPFIHTEQISPLDQLGIEQPTLVDFRAASPTDAEIDAAMQAKEYAKALAQIEEALSASNEAISLLQEMPTYDDEALLYEKELNVAHNHQLRWLRIYTLVRLGQCDEAITDLEFYITLKTDHRREAKDLLRLLRHP